MKGSTTRRPVGPFSILTFMTRFDDGLDISLGDTGYYSEGYWDAGVINGQNLPRSIWAHDPPTSGQDVPAPLPILLIGTGLLLLCQTRGKRRALSVSKYNIDRKYTNVVGTFVAFFKKKTRCLTGSRLRACFFNQLTKGVLSGWVSFSSYGLLFLLRVSTICHSNRPLFWAG